VLYAEAPQKLHRDVLAPGGDHHLVALPAPLPQGVPEEVHVRRVGYVQKDRQAQ
jgi:hypothetical protein